ncbi:MAG: TIGR03067 domain-containing protein [Gemmataceae bacterium]
MRQAILFLLLPALYGPAQPPAEDAVERDLQTLQGTWRLARYEREGKVWDREGIARDFKDKGGELRLRIEGDKIFLGDDPKPSRLRRDDRPRDLTFHLDPTVTPKRCDISIGSDWGFMSRGAAHWEAIYRFQGDRLEICLAHNPEARPTRFGADPKREWLWLLVYERVPAPAK